MDLANLGDQPGQSRIMCSPPKIAMDPDLLVLGTNEGELDIDAFADLLVRKDMVYNQDQVCWGLERHVQMSGEEVQEGPGVVGCQEKKCKRDQVRWGLYRHGEPGVQSGPGE
eukprot:1161700-Pelagomonas_calceolata.AAC.2